MRLFIAVNFSEITRSRLLSLGDELRKVSRQGNFSQPENLHLTLAFLGECDKHQCDTAKAAMDGVSFQPFDISAERLGRFPRGNSDIWWVGLAHSSSLLSLRRGLVSRLEAVGFALDKQEFKAHITLGREIITSALPRQIETFGERVTQIDLMKSERINGKLVYTSIYSINSKV